MAIIPIEISAVEARSANIYEAIVILSKRTRQINEELKVEYNQRVEILNAKNKESEDQDHDLPPNPDQIRVSKEFEKRAKPSEQAVDDLLSDKVSYRYKNDDAVAI
ncbi:MAG: DNA-directed RNA polymerase subunit omega [Bacteroidota bacterium]